MQYGALFHSSHKTAELSEIWIFPMTWPAYSPDLNQIDNIWNLLKDFIERNYPDPPDGKERSHDELHTIVTEAWSSIKPEELSELVASMP